LYSLFMMAIRIPITMKNSKSASLYYSEEEKFS
jgi:hypothetical protein